MGVLMLDRWEQSEGVRAELATAAELSMRVRYLPPDRADSGGPIGLNPPLV